MYSCLCVGVCVCASISMFSTDVHVISVVDIKAGKHTLGLLFVKQAKNKTERNGLSDFANINKTINPVLLNAPINRISSPWLAK